jgi:type III secretion protein D
MSNPPVSKQLRILSGTHAGASLDLAPGRYSLGSSPGCDVSITDWRFEELTIAVGDDGVVTTEGPGETPYALQFEDFVPVDFKGVVVCLGSSDGEWPGRAQLFETLRPADVPSRKTWLPGIERLNRVDRRLAGGVAAVFALLLCGGWALSANSKTHELPKPTLISVDAGLRQALAAVVGPRLLVSEDKGSLVVEGLVDDDTQARAAARAIDAVPPAYPVVRRVSVATDIAETIRSAVGLPNAKVEYRGGGVFSFGVQTDDIAAAQAAVSRVASDLAPTVRRIDAVLDEAPPTQPAMPAMRSTWIGEDGTSVMEGRDGAKYLVMGVPASAPVREAEVSGAAAPPATASSAASVAVASRP